MEIQLGVALIILLIAVATLVNVLTFRLRRNINRARVVKERLRNLSGNQAAVVRTESRLLMRRASPITAVPRCGCTFSRSEHP
jgi:hypothetical protein